MKKNLLRSLVIAPLATLSIATASFAQNAADVTQAQAQAQAQIQAQLKAASTPLTKAEIDQTIATVTKLEAALKSYATDGVEASTLMQAPAILGTEAGHRPTVVQAEHDVHIPVAQQGKDGKGKKDKAPKQEAAQPTETFAVVRYLADVQGQEIWTVAPEKGKDGKTHLIAKLDLDNSAIFSSMGGMQLSALASTDVAKMTSDLNDPAHVPVKGSLAGIIGGLKVNDLSTPDMSDANLAHVATKRVGLDAAGAPVVTDLTTEFYGMSCGAPVVASSLGAANLVTNAIMLQSACYDGKVTNEDGKPAATFNEVPRAVYQLIPPVKPQAPQLAPKPLTVALAS